ncbi:hypothetical protein [Roseomonas fluvialis]|nr:hypothetical protein [Roseomonas fluvialis]
MQREGGARIGIEVRLETAPVQTFFDRAARREFSLFMIGFGVYLLVPPRAAQRPCHDTQTERHAPCCAADIS